MKSLSLALLLFFVSCSDHSSNPVHSVENNAPLVSADKKTITFPPKSLGLSQFKFQEVSAKGEFVSVIAPAHVIASLTSEKQNMKKVILESAALNELYYSYAQAVENRKNLEKNFVRLKDMALQQAATVKDLREGERDLLNSKYNEMEFENKLKSTGIFPEVFKDLAPGVIVLVSDVPESQLSSVDKGEDVDVFFNSYALEKFQGKVKALGEVIDPVSRTIKIIVTVTNKDNKLKPGMYAKIEFGDFNHHVMSIPTTSVFTMDGKSFVFVSKDPVTFVLREVVISAYGEGFAGVSSGLTVHEKIVTEGTLLLKRLIFQH